MRTLQDAEGNSKGAGIVEFDSSADALHAISMLSNSELGGRQIHVRMAAPYYLPCCLVEAARMHSVCA